MKSRKKRLLYLSNSYPDTVSGVTTVVTNLLSWMKQDYQVAVICPNHNTRFSKKTLSGLTHYLLPSYPTLIRKDVRFVTPNPLQAQKAFDDFHPDLVHLHDPSPASIVLKEIALRNRVPVIFSHHFTPQMVLGYLPDALKTAAQNNDNLNKTILQLTCRLYEGADRLIVPTRTVQDTLLPLTRVPISIISSGVDYQLFQTPQPKLIEALARTYHLPNKPFALYVGRLDPDKNLSVLLHAWSHLSQETQGFRLVIAGEGGSSAKLQELAQDLGISSQITWTGHIPQEELPALYQNPFARLFVIPSPIESQSIVTLMAQAAGLPVVAANAGALPEIVIDGQTGYLCHPEKASSFAKKILSLLEHPDLAKQLGQAGSKIASTHDFPSVIKEYKKLYDRTLLLSHHPRS